MATAFRRLPSDVHLNTLTDPANMVIASQSYIFDPRPKYPLLVTAKRYWATNSPHLSDPDAITLIFAHATGFHKEQWEPTLDDLYTLLATNSGSVKVRDMWSIDAPNHGDAAILNEKALKWGYDPVCMCKYFSGISIYSDTQL